MVLHEFVGFGFFIVSPQAFQIASVEPLYKVNIHETPTGIL
jgi:hypothetical protein